VGFDLGVEEGPARGFSFLLSMTFKFPLDVEERKLALPTQFVPGLQGGFEFIDVHGPVLVKRVDAESLDCTM
jgi:hypothetical protein